MAFIYEQKFDENFVHVIHFTGNDFRHYADACQKSTFFSEFSYIDYLCECNIYKSEFNVCSHIILSFFQNFNAFIQFFLSQLQ